VLPDGATDDDRKAVQSRHQELIRRVKDAGGNVGSRIERGQPSDAIARVGRDGYSLIVVGKHGQNWIEGRTIGSTAARVCEIARLPVLMVPLA
jgi:nucleotide-binding universal stress UspA family protein